ncbi:MAG: glycosyltransferase family protein [Candidatus Diapherotrites archaeon]
MARIIFTLCGVGLGHASRDSSLIKELRKKHDVKVVTYGNALDYLKEFKPIEMEGFPVYYDTHGEYNELISIGKNIPRTPKVIGENLEFFRKIIHEFKPNLIVSDYDVFGFYAAKFFGIKHVFISNMHSLKYFKLKRRHKMESFSLVTGVLGLWPFIGIENLFVIYLRKRKNLKGVKFFDVLVKEEVMKSRPKIRDYYLVYSEKNQLKTIIPLLKKTNEKFIIYGIKEKNSAKTRFFEKYSKKGFLKHLTECKGIISHGGLSLISEAIYLKKPVYTFTSAKFYERFFNGATIEELGFGLLEEHPTKEALEEFFRRNSEFRKNIVKAKFKPGNNELLKEINKLLK